MEESCGRQIKAFSMGDSYSLLPLEEHHICRDIWTQAKHPQGFPSRNEAPW